MRKVNPEERRQRLGLRHQLAAPAADPVEAARAMVALHSSDPATVFLSARARVADLTVPALEHALYSERSLVRVHGMRRTLWVIDLATLPIVHHSSTSTIADREWKRTIKLLETGEVTDDGDAWLNEVIPKTLAAIAVGGEVLTRDLTATVPGLDGKITIHNQAGKLMGTTGLASRVVLLLGMMSSIIRTRPAGTWVSSQYRLTETSQWLGRPVPELEMREASARLVKQWLHAFGPASETDLRWWTGWTLTQLRQALSDVGAVEVGLGHGTGFLLAEDLEPVRRPEPWVALLPSLDPTTMGWKERDWYLGGYETALFDRNGNAGPTVWADGRVVGGWAQRSDGKVAYEIFEDIGADATRMVADAAGRLETWLDEVVVTPRFRSPHEKGLAS